MVGTSRSAPLVQFHSTTAGYSRAFVVPSNSTVLVKSAAFLVNATASVRVAMIVSSPSSTVNINVVDESVVPNKALLWQGWIALGPGDNVLLYFGDGGVYGWVSGAILSSAPPYPPATGPSLLLNSDLPTLMPTQ